MVCGGGCPRNGGGQEHYHGAVYNNVVHRQRQGYPFCMPRNNELTTNEKRALIVIDKHIKRFGAPPSQRHIARELEMWPASGTYLVKMLRAKGYVAANEVKPTAKARPYL